MRCAYITCMHHFVFLQIGPLRELFQTNWTRKWSFLWKKMKNRSLVRSIDIWALKRTRTSIKEVSRKSYSYIQIHKSTKFTEYLFYLCYQSSTSFIHSILYTIYIPKEENLLVCVIWCLVKLAACENLLSHNVHANGFSPEWTYMCWKMKLPLTKSTRLPCKQNHFKY